MAVQEVARCRTEGGPRSLVQLRAVRELRHAFGMPSMTSLQRGQVLARLDQHLRSAFDVPPPDDDDTFVDDAGRIWTLQITTVGRSQRAGRDR